MPLSISYTSILAAVTRTVFNWPKAQTHSAAASAQEGDTPVFHPAIAELQKIIEEDADLYLGCHQMFDQVPNDPRYDLDPTGRPQVKNYYEMLSRFNALLTCAPEFDEGGAGDLVPAPFSALLNWLMITPAGLRVFTNNAFNVQMKKIFQVWAEFLSTPNSRYVLTHDVRGWFGPSARKSIKDFEQTFQCNPSTEYWGYTSWDDFFTRKLCPGVRPVHHSQDDSVIASACESITYKIGHNVQATSDFWLKGQPCSLSHMLKDDPRAPDFFGGTVYQAYLSATDYHRWHSPVSGQISKIVLVSGAYFAVSPSIEFEDGDPDFVGRSQAFLSHVATRMLIFIEADNPDIGLMCFVAIGMAEISSCEATVVEGQRVCKGDELGMFHYGGSSYCLVLRPETKIEFSETVLQSLIDQKTRVLVNGTLAYVSRRDV